MSNQTADSTTTMSVVHDLMADTLSAELRCLNCMQNKGTAARCPHCGYDERQHKNHPLYLKPRTLLKNQFLIGKCLGQGGFGITYIAFDCWLRKKVAIKEYLPASLATRDFLAATVIPLKKQEAAFMQGLHLFIEEARNLARFDHPNIVRVINFFEANQTGYMVMEYLDGENLTDLLTRQPDSRVSLNIALTVMQPILEALTVVHSQHIYHRDISLQNIRLLADGTPILIDFGAARHVVGENSQTLDLVLKHGYSPIEQYSGRGRIGAWTDIYACGALLYLLLTGRLPPAATDRFAEDCLPPLPEAVGEESTPHMINQAIMRALAIRPEQRYQSVAQFQAALRGEPVPEWVDSPATPAQKPSAVRGLLVLLGLVLIGGALYWRFYPPAPDLIAQQLAQAHQYLAHGQLVSPEQHNAWQTYRNILQQDPHQVQALAGLQRLARHYQHTAEQAYQAADLTAAFAAVKQGLQILPQDDELLALQALLVSAEQQQQQNQATADLIAKQLGQAEQAFAVSQLAAAASHYQAVLAQMPEHPQASEGLRQVAAKYEALAREQQDNPASSLFLIQEGLQLFPNHVGLLSLREQLTDASLVRQQQIDQLLTRAEQHLQALRLTEPTGNNAYELYQQVLQLSPDNQQALVGFSRIADQYEQLARAEQRNKTRYRSLLEKGLAVMPTHAGLLSLSQKLATPPTSTPAQVKPTPPPVKVAPPPPETKMPIVVSETAKPEPPAPTPAQQLRAQADAALAAAQYDIAADRYQASLRLQPKQPELQAKLTQIVTYYQQQAERAQQTAQWQNSLEWIDKGLAILPQHVELLALQATAQDSLNASPPESATKSVIFTPSF